MRKSFRPFCFGKNNSSAWGHAALQIRYGDLPAMRFQMALPTIKENAMVATATAQARNSTSTSHVLLFMARSIT